MGEPINAEAWHWYNDIVGEKRCVVVDTWWQTGESKSANRLSIEMALSQNVGAW